MSTPTHEQIFQVAMDLRKAGFDVIPVHPTDKHPHLKGWQNYQWSDEELRQKIIDLKWSASLRNQECLDFDTGHGAINVEPKFMQWQELVKKAMPGLNEKLTFERTQNNGFHVWYRCTYSESAHVLAYRHPTEKELKANPQTKKIGLIETRYQNTLVSPSYGYTLIQGEILKMQEITPEERLVLLHCASVFDEFPNSSEEYKITIKAETDGYEPWNVYAKNCGTEPFNLLIANGWTVVDRVGDVVFLCRPGKTHSVSATFGYTGAGTLHNFSSNGAPFEVGRSYDPFQIFALYKHNGDYKAADKEVSERWPFEKDLPIKADNSLDIGTPGTLTPEAERVHPSSVKKLRLMDKLTTLADLRQEEYAFEWIWEEAIAKRNTTLMSSLAKGGKTTLYRTLLRALLTGEEFLGHPTLECKVLIVSEEDKTVWLAERDKFQIASENLFLLSRPYPKPYMGQWIDIVKQIQEICVQKEINLVIFDTLSKLLPIEKENDPAGWEYALTQLNFILEMDIAILFIHHNNKNPNMQHSSRIRGSSALAGHVDQIIMLDYVTEGKTNQRLLTLEGRLTKPQESIIEFNEETYEYKIIGDPKAFSKTYKLEHILTLISGHGTPLSTKQVVELWNWGVGERPSQRTTQRLIDELCRTAKLKIVKEDKAPNGTIKYYDLNEEHDPLAPSIEEVNQQKDVSPYPVVADSNIEAEKSNNRQPNRQKESNEKKSDENTTPIKMPIEEKSSLEKSIGNSTDMSTTILPIKPKETSEPKTITYENGKTAVVEEVEAVGLPEKDKKGNYILPGIKT